MGFERIRYPDGQVGAKFVEDGTGAPMVLKERINSYEDLFYVRAVADIIKRYRFGTNWLFIPCMFGQRSDRRFDRHQSFDLKLITDVINACDFDVVKILDPHSDVTLALVNNSEKVSSLEYVKQSIDHYHAWNTAHHNGTEDPILVSPDAGAFKKVFGYGQELGYEVVGANKCRNKDGTITLSFTGDVKNRACFIVDDLCDGGYTFILLTEALKKQGAREVYLYISHGLFSKGFAPLHQAGITHVYCTNSVKDLDPNEGVIRTGDPQDYDTVKVKDFVTQFKVI